MRPLVCLVLVLLTGCASIVEPKAFRDDMDRCFVATQWERMMRVEQVGEEFCAFANVPRRFYTRN
jgi:hypothetical protein